MTPARPCANSAASRLLLQRPPDRRFTAAVLARQLCHRLASSVALGDTPALAVIKQSRPAELRALSFCPLDPFFTPLADQAALEFGNAAHDRHNQPANIGCGIAPALTERNKAAAHLLHFVKDVLQVTARPGQAV